MLNETKFTMEGSLHVGEKHFKFEENPKDTSNQTFKKNCFFFIFVYSTTIDSIQNYVIVIATLFRHFEWGKYQKLPLLYVEIQ